MFNCQVCGKVCRSVQGLSGHNRLAHNVRVDGEEQALHVSTGRELSPVLKTTTGIVQVSPGMGTFDYTPTVPTRLIRRRSRRIPQQTHLDTPPGGPFYLDGDGRFCYQRVLNNSNLHNPSNMEYREGLALVENQLEDELQRRELAKRMKVLQNPWIPIVRFGFGVLLVAGGLYLVADSGILGNNNMVVKAIRGLGSILG